MINYAYRTHRSPIKASLIAILSLSLAACGFQDYIAKPIDTKTIADKINNRRADDHQFQEYLINNGYNTAQLPIQQWTVDDLVYCALFFNPSLNIARAQWRSAEAAKLTAAEMRLPTLSGNYEKTDSNETSSPHAYKLSIDLPIETANKRNIRIESAQHLSEAAKLKIALSAWQLRNEVIGAVYDYIYNQKLITLLEKEQAKRQEIVAIFQKRTQVGEASNLELSKANLLLQDASAILEAAQRNQPILTSKLASSLGLSPAALERMQIADSIDAESILASVADKQTSEIQSRAIFNRLDLRIALERYAVAEAKVKLEIAKQYPDLVFKPGYAYDFGEKIWSLGLSGLMTILTKNKLAIAEAKQLREVEVAQFEALQANVISEVNTANARLAQAKQILDSQKIFLAQQQASTKRMDSKLRAGEIDRLEMSYAKLEEIIAEKNYARANYQIATQINALESAIQAPLAESKINNDKLENLSYSNQ